MTRVKLKIAIIENGKSQRQIAAACEIAESRFSTLVNGLAEPRDSERQAIADVLGKPAEELFEESGCGMRRAIAQTTATELESARGGARR